MLVRMLTQDRRERILKEGLQEAIEADQNRKEGESLEDAINRRREERRNGAQSK